MNYTEIKSELTQNIQATSKSIHDFVETYRKKLIDLFQTRNEESDLTSHRGLPPYVLRSVLECKPLSTFIPTEYNGRGGSTHEALAMLETTAYQSLPLSLMMGINGALFLQPVANYGSNEAKETIFSRFLDKNNMGGLMITEPDYGSDALHMQTHFEKRGNQYQIRGLKHWAGLTGWADYWLITAREKDENGDLGRDIGFFVHDSNKGGIDVKEYYDNLGLLMLPYGRNQIDIHVNESFRLQPKSTGVKMMLDTLHRSRLQFPGMSTGHLKRVMDEAIQHCKERFVGGKSLIDYDQVKDRLAKIQAYFTVSSAMSYFTSNRVSLDRDTSRMDLEANTIKSVATDFMQDASQSLLQLFGAKGYRLGSIAGRAVIDSRPFQIFEGSNDILYQQISESVIKLMKGKKMTNLYEFLKSHSLSEYSSDYFKNSTNFSVDYQMAQRQLVKLGRAISRIFSMDMTIRMGEDGFHPEMIASSLQTIREEIEELLSSYRESSKAGVVDDYKSGGSWLNLVKA